jgi:hypothetical protein
MEPLDPWGIASTNLRAIGCKVSSRRRTTSTLSVCWRRKLIRTSVQLLAEDVAKLFAHGKAERAQPWRAFVRHVNPSSSAKEITFDVNIPRCSDALDN